MIIGYNNGKELNLTRLIKNSFGDRIYNTNHNQTSLHTFSSTQNSSTISNKTPHILNSFDPENPSVNFNNNNNTQTISSLTNANNHPQVQKELNPEMLPPNNNNNNNSSSDDKRTYSNIKNKKDDNPFTNVLLPVVNPINNNNRNNYNNSLIWPAEAEEKTKEWRRECALKGHPSAFIGHEEFCWWLMDLLKPSVIVDLGVDWGYSTFVFAGAKHGKVYGIDIFTGDGFTGRRDTSEHVFYIAKILNSAGCNLEIIKGKFQDESKKWNGGAIDILHIDGCPEYFECKGDFDTWLPHLNKQDGVILMHDVVYYQSVGAVFDQAPLELYKMQFPHSAGLGVLSYNKSIIDAICKKYEISNC